MLEGTITGRIPACVIVATQNLLFVCTCDAGGNPMPVERSTNQQVHYPPNRNTSKSDQFGRP